MKKTGFWGFCLFAIFNVILFSTSFVYKDGNNSNYKKYDGGDVDNINNIIVLDMDKKEINLDVYKGKVLLIVNVASKCGYTKQYAGLQQLYDKYKERGFEILAFPCNDFGGQEPGSNEEILEFCTTRFDVKFKLFDKISVLGNNKIPLYKILTDNPVTGASDVKWNFEKFLIDKSGRIVNRYRSNIEPMSAEITSAVEKELNMQ